jgi:hypothetical protein
MNVSRTDAPPGPPRAGLRRFTGPRPPAEERCELCAAALTGGHRHLVDTERRSLVCACVPCSVLFDRTGAGGRFRTVPARFASDPDLAVTAGHWESLGVPVGVAFFFRNAALGTIVALYPSPAGATESEVTQRAFDAAFGSSPLARALQPDVEALLVRRSEHGAGGATGAGTCHLVPIDAAYELVGRLRMHWHGFDGGSRVRAELEAFFADVEARAVPLSPDGAVGAYGGTPA